ncbi:acyltransferase [Methylocystis sp. 9N]|uniref:Acyltransferase n=1 Tax=Methylocystis borbori TaxID=3118750 RepID=A0ABU7XDR1_9HYPH
MSLRHKARLVPLDALRGLAAFLVLTGHIRAYVFHNLGEIDQPGFLLKGFYFLTGIGHQAVIIFFALSGFLVGGQALADILAGRFLWSRYLLRRLTRLWIVVIPALLLTFLFDKGGMLLSGGAGYDGRYYDVFLSGPHKPIGADLSLPAFLGNVAFLQTITVPIFGSNGPMWSLANEFWYYIIFPMAAWLACVSMTTLERLALFIGLLAVVLLLPASILRDGLIWIGGAAAAWCANRPELTFFFKRHSTRVVAIILFFFTLVASKARPDVIGDLWLGVAVAAALPALALSPNIGGRRFACAAFAGSEISYSLYLTHFPLLTFLILSTAAPARFFPNGEGFGVFVLLLLITTSWATIIWYCFERHTDRVYRYILRQPSASGSFSPQRRGKS